MAQNRDHRRTGAGIFICEFVVNADLGGRSAFFAIFRFQDTDLENAFGQHQGSKDDYYIYNERGELSDFFPIGGDRESDLASPEGYANIKQAILDAPFQSRLSVDTVAAVKIDGIAGRTYRIDFSEDLGDKKQWKPLKTVTIYADQFIYVDLEATRLRKQRFYRVEEVP